MGFTFNEYIFGKTDIRGIVGESINPELFKIIGGAYARYINEHSGNSNDIWVSVARDARNHSLELAEALIGGLTSAGINVLDLGLCPSPLAYFSEFQNSAHIHNLAGTLVVTASHNPSQYNGIKMTYQKSALTEGEIAKLKEVTKQELEFPSFDQHKKGIHKKYDILSSYKEIIANSFGVVGKGVKIVVDSGNATAGVIAPELYRELGCEVIDIFSEPDGNFPNHHPNPSDEKNIKVLIEKVRETGADFGIAFDGDSDRVGIVDNTGYNIPGDQLLLIFALDILNQSKAEKPVFISEVKCSQALFDTINQNGGQAIMWKTGHAFIKSKMREENAILAGEMSGHIFFNDRYHGFDDAIYAGCRFIEIVAKNKRNNPDFKVSDLINSLPKTYTSKEIRVPCPNELKLKVLDQLRQEIDKKPDIFGKEIKKIITIDGLRIVFNGGFALIRASNTEPTFTLRFEGESQKDMDNYKNVMLQILDALLCGDSSHS